MKRLDQRSQMVVEAYGQRFNQALPMSWNDLGHAHRGRFIAALERALARGMPLLDFELQEFEVPLRRRIWLRLKRIVRRTLPREP